MSTFDLTAARAFLADAYAPWILDLNIEIVAITATGGRFRLPENPRLSRDIGVVCGQAIASVADTVGVIGVLGANGTFRSITTVDFSCNFMRPLKTGDVDITVEALRIGRRMATAQAYFYQAGDERLAATALCTYAFVD